MTYTVGLTGGIGSGKSTVGKIFRELGVKVVDADQVARYVVEPGSPALAEIASYFGSDILHNDGSLNRAALRKIVFQSAEKKAWLEALLHPLIRQAIVDDLETAQSPYAILESPLLLEMNQDQEVDRVLVVDVPESVQLTRATARDLNTEEQIRAIMSAQLQRKERRARAHDIIDNTRDLTEVKLRVHELHHLYLKLAEQSTNHSETNVTPA